MREKRAFLFISLCLVITLFTSFFNVRAQTFQVYGRVVDRGENPVPGLRVIVQRGASVVNDAVTNTEGNYAVSFTAGNPITVTYSSTEWIGTPIQSISGKTTHMITKVVRRVSEAASWTPEEASEVKEALAYFKRYPDIYREEIASYSLVLRELKKKGRQPNKEEVSISHYSLDTQFASIAVMSAVLEKEIGHLAIERGSSDSVKQFGQMLVDSKTQFIDEMMQITSGIGMVLPNQLNAKDQATVTKLSNLSGERFDHEFLKLIQGKLQRDFSLFQRQSERGMHLELKALASRTLLEIQEHLQKAHRLTL